MGPEFRIPLKAIITSSLQTAFKMGDYGSKKGRAHIRGPQEIPWIYSVDRSPCLGDLRDP